MSITIWSKTKSGDRETYHIAAICHDGYVCHPSGRINYHDHRRAHSVYVRTKEGWEPLPAEPDEVGNLAVCKQCKNQLACVAAKLEGGLIKLHKKDLEHES